MQTIFACDVVDDTGKKIHLQHPAQRIIALAPDLVEILFSIDAGKNIVGVMKGSDFPVQAKSLPIVANYNSVDMEAVLALHPDLIITWSDFRPTEQFKNRAIPVYVSNQKNIEDIPKTMTRFGCLTGQEKIAANVANQFSKHLQQIKIKYARKKTISVFYQVWSRPLITITKKSWINNIISLCGGKNIFADLQGVSPEVNIESIMVMNPDVMMGSDMQNWSQWPKISAVKLHHVYSLQSDLIERAGPRMLEGVENVCHLLDKARDDILRK